MRIAITFVAAALTLASAPAAEAFCGFYVSGAGADLFNDATQVVMMRKGTRTVLSMQNTYEGPPENFALVVPVPVVLHKTEVKTLPDEVFAKVDKLAAPRLVEYWEQDPCRPQPRYEGVQVTSIAKPSPTRKRSAKDLGVKVEAKFDVGEYQIVILSAKDSTGLDTWLRQEKYKIPEGAEPYLKPYVDSGSKFFVAKVNVDKVKFEEGRAKLSPLRFHYDSKEFSLPIRLGLMNSQGTQDLIVHILSPGQRYEVANRKNVTIPTNLDVADSTRKRFGEFYAALFDRTLEVNKGAVVTEYAWDSATCDPCPTPPLQYQDLLTLGADVIDGQGQIGKKKAKPAPGSGPPGRVGRLPQRRMRRRRRGMVLTRLHARYGKDVDEDLVFKAVPPIVGGREHVVGAAGKLEEGAKPGSVNNFQGRYAIRHPWTGPIECDNPRRGVWGGPPKGDKPPAAPATDLAFVPRGKAKLANFVKADVSEIGFKRGEAPRQEAPSAGDEPENGEAKSEKGVTKDGKATAPEDKKNGCTVGGRDRSSRGLWLLLALGFLAGMRRRR